MYVSGPLVSFQKWCKKVNMCVKFSDESVGVGGLVTGISQCYPINELVTS